MRLAPLLALSILITGCTSEDAEVEVSYGTVASFPSSTYADDLRDYAVDLHNGDGVGMGGQQVAGVELATMVLFEAMDYYRGKWWMTNDARLDAVMRDASIVFLGPTAYGLTTEFDTRVPGTPDALLTDFSAELLRLNNKPSNTANCADPNSWRYSNCTQLDKLVALGQGGALGNPKLDYTLCTDWRDEFCDVTRNQIYHTWAYLYLSYISGDERSVNLGVFVHEWAGGGGTVQDLRVGHWGAKIGTILRDVRDGQLTDEGYATLPFLVGAMLAQDATLSSLSPVAAGKGYGDSSLIWNEGIDRSELASELNRLVTENIDDPGGQGWWGAFKFKVRSFLCGCSDAND